MGMVMSSDSHPGGGGSQVPHKDTARASTTPPSHLVLRTEQAWLPR